MRRRRGGLPLSHSDANKSLMDRCLVVRPSLPILLTLAMVVTATFSIASQSRLVPSLGGTATEKLYVPAPAQPARSCAMPLDLVVLSDRGTFTREQPLKALVNSILLYTTRPVNLNIVTSVQMPWLGALNSSQFRVHFHPTSKVYARTRALIQRTRISSTHYSARHAFQKLFLSTLDYPKGTGRKVLMLDDDMVFYEDLTPLADLVMRNPSRLSLYCQLDPGRVKFYFQNRPHNGDSEKYCISGMMGLPLGNGTAELFETAATEMKLEYPDIKFAVADQNVVNRVYAHHKESVDLIPCEWSCDWISCNKTVGICKNCPTGICRSYHFNARTYTKHASMPKPEWNWDYYHDLDSKFVLLSSFLPRVKSACSGAVL